MTGPDQNLFFKQATLLICSSLDIEIALWRCRQFISQYLPADEIYKDMLDVLREAGCVGRDHQRDELADDERAGPVTERNAVAVHQLSRHGRARTVLATGLRHRI